MKPINFWHGVILIISLLSVSFSSANGIKPIPSLNKILEKTPSYSVGKNTSFHEIDYSIKKFYYQIQYQEQKLTVLNEVKGHFKNPSVKPKKSMKKGRRISASLILQSLN